MNRRTLVLFALVAAAWALFAFTRPARAGYGWSFALPEVGWGSGGYVISACDGPNRIYAATVGTGSAPALVVIPGDCIPKPRQAEAK